MISKESAQYTPHGTKAEHCAICSNYEPPNCKVVSGKVVPDGWCKYFKRAASKRANKAAGDSLGETDMNKVNLWGNVQKVEENDDGTITVYGIASTEAVDSAGEIVRADALRAAIPDYLSDFPALREMHANLAAGSTVAMEVGEDNVTRIEALVTDPTSILKIKKKTLRGFSIGGKVTSRDPNNRKIITGVTLQEVSLVDRPACPEAKLEFWRADGVYMEGEETEGAVATEVEENTEETTTSDDTSAKTASADGADSAVDPDTSVDDKSAVAAGEEETIVEPDEKTAAAADVEASGEDPQSGAKSASDDGGSVVAQPEAEETAEEIYKREFDAKQRKKDAKSGSAMKDGSFPIENKEDLRNAIRLAGKAKDPAAARAHIKRRAKALGAEDMIPDTWNDKKDSKKVANAAEDKDALVKATADPIDPAKVGDVMADGAGNADSQTPGAPVAGATVMANFPPGPGAGSVRTDTGATDNAGQDKLTTTDTPIVDPVAAETPVDGKDLRTHKDPGAKAADVDPISAARAAAEKALKGATASVDKVIRAAGVANLPEPLRAGADLRKGLGTVARLGYLLTELSYILSETTYEADMEGDDSPVPVKLREAIKPLAEVYRAMSEEELAELLAFLDAKTASALAVAVAGGDVVKAFVAAAGEDGLAKFAPVASEELRKATDRIAALESGRDDLLKINGELTTGLDTLSKRVEQLAEMPMPAKTAGAGTTVETVLKSVSKEEDTANTLTADDTKVAGGAKTEMSVEDVQKALGAMSADERADVLLRASLRQPIPINR